MMKDLKDKVVVVTGAASGIGREMAKAFAERGARLALADIDLEGLRAIREELEAAGRAVYSQEVDVADADRMEDFCACVYREMGRVDVLCNNAGVALGGCLEHLTLEDWRWIVGINLMGVIHGCHFFYPRMIEQGGGGHIVNTASLAGLVPSVGLLAYTTTKFAVVGFSEALRPEAARHGIGVTVICPSFVLTGISRNARIRSIREGESLEEGIKKSEEILGKRKYTARSVAEETVKAVEKNRGVVRICPEAYIMDYLYRLSRALFGSINTHILRPGRNTQPNAGG